MRQEFEQEYLQLGLKIAYYRKLRGLSQKQLAAQLQTNGCDITETMLGHIETGYRSTSIFEISKAKSSPVLRIFPAPSTITRSPGWVTRRKIAIISSGSAP